MLAFLYHVFWQKYQKREWKVKVNLRESIFLMIFLFCSCSGPSSGGGGLLPKATHSSISEISAPLVDTTENIHPGMVEDGKQPLSYERGTIDYVWGSDTPRQPPGIHKSFYFKFDRSGGFSGTTAFPIYYDKSWFLANHPDWLVYLCDKTTLAYEFGDSNVPLDITNPAVLQFILNTWIYPALDKGYDGIAFDNVNLDNTVSVGRCGIWKTKSNGDKEWVYLYGNAKDIHGYTYVRSVVNWAKFMYNAIHTYKPGATMEMNFTPDNGGVPSQPLSFNEQLLPYMDLAFNEGGYTNGGDGFTTGSNWLQEVNFSRDLASHGKGQLITFGYSFSDLTQQQKQWALSNYLLVKGAHFYIYIASMADNGANYGYLNIIPEYSAKVGYAIGAVYRSQGVYVRNYSNGITIVNPSSSRSFAIKLPAKRYKDLYGDTISSSLTLSAHSGIVLLNVV